MFDVHLFKLQVIDIEESVAEVQNDSVEIKLVFVGDAATGKTSLLERYSNNRFSIASQQTVSLIMYCLALWLFNGHE